MTAKIRGYQWTMNYRGFDVYYSAKNDQYKNVPNANLIAKDLATVEHYAVADSVEEAISMIDDHFEVIFSMCDDATAPTY